MINKEIERKFVATKEDLDLMPLGQDYDIEEEMLVEQFYHEIEEGVQTRFRKIVVIDSIFKVPSSINCYITEKKGEGLVREEDEQEISLALYSTMLESLNCKPIQKTRLVIHVDSQKCETDLYHNNELGNLIVNEFEFESIEQAKAFMPKEWFGKEVTDDKKYSNYNLWKKINNK